LGSQSFTSFFIPWTAIRAPRRAKGTKKNTTIRTSIARRAKNVGFSMGFVFAQRLRDWNGRSLVRREQEKTVGPILKLA
jgi:hypothetical protein